MIKILAKGAMKMSEHPDIKQTFLRAFKRGRYGMLLWLLNWIRQLFGLIRTIITQRHLYSHWLMFIIFDVARFWIISRCPFRVHSNWTSKARPRSWWITNSSVIENILWECEHNQSRVIIESEETFTWIKEARKAVTRSERARSNGVGISKWVFIGW